MIELDKKISKYKAISLQIGRFEEYSYLELSFKITNPEFVEHYGVTFYLELFGFHFIFDIYDVRHM